MIDKDILAGLKNGDNEMLAHVYKLYRTEFLRFGATYELKTDELVDIYQDAIIALRHNTINGQYDGSASSLKTYLFSIGKYMIYAKLKALKKTQLIADYSEFMSETQKVTKNAISQGLTQEQQQLRKAFKMLGEKCKTVLTLFYYRGFDLEDIMKAMKYTNKDVVKSQKSRCLKSLKSMIFKR